MFCWLVYLFVAVLLWVDLLLCVFVTGSFALLFYCGLLVGFAIAIVDWLVFDGLLVVRVVLIVVILSFFLLYVVLLVVTDKFS